MDAPREEDVEFVSSHDRTLLNLAELLACSPALVHQTWHKLDLSSFEDPNELNNLNEAAGIYRSAVQTLDRLNRRLDLLPAEERDRLIVERNPVLEQMKAAALAFEELYVHRKSVIDRNPRKGNQDARADQIAELVAQIFISTNRVVTFGHAEGEPTTDFGRAVQQALKICNNKRLEALRHDYITNWRQPANKAFQRHRFDTK